MDEEIPTPVKKPILGKYTEIMVKAAAATLGVMATISAVALLEKSTKTMFGFTDTEESTEE